MTNMDEITIFDEIVNCGILEEDSVLNLGAGHNGGKFLETLREYNGNFESGKIIAVDANPKKIKLLTKKFKDELSIIEIPLQDYIDTEPDYSDWVVLTGVFDNNFYGDKQYDFVTSIVYSCLNISNKGVIFSLNENVNESFQYVMIYFFSYFTNTYDRVTIKKNSNGNYIFCIFK